MRRAFILASVLLLLAASAHADISAARAALAAGAYDEAARRGEADGGAAGLEIAAEAALAQYLFVDRREAALARVEADAGRALALNGEVVEARLALAAALGLQGRRVSLVEAWRQRYAQRGRRLIEDALALKPGDAHALALLGGWHLEVLRRAGAAGGLFLGARLDRGVAAFEHARAAAPDDPAVALHYAIALLALNPHKYAGKAAELLARASACRANDALESAAREEARRIGAVLSASGAQAAAQVADAALL